MLRITIPLASCLALFAPSLAAPQENAPQQSAPQENSPRPTLDDGCRVAFTALATGSFDGLAAAFPTGDEMRAIVESELAGASEAQRAAAWARIEEGGGIEAVRTAALAKLRERFERAREESSRLFSWRGARYLCALPHATPPRAMKGTAFEVAPVEFLVHADGEVWSFGANDVLHGPRGWAFTEFLSFKGRRAIEDPAADDSAALDASAERDWARLEQEYTAVREARDEAIARAELNELRAREAEARSEDLEARVRLELAYSQERIEAAEAELARQRTEIDELRASCEALTNQRDLLEQQAEDAERSRQESEAFLSAAAGATDSLAAMQREALELAVQRLEAELAAQRREPGSAGAPAPDGSAPREPFRAAWLEPVEREPEARARLRRALATELTAAYGTVGLLDLIDYVRKATGAEIVVLGDDELAPTYATVPFECYGTPAGVVLEEAVGAGALREHGGRLFIGSRAWLDALGKPLLPEKGAEASAGAATVKAALASARVPLEVESVPLTDVLRFIAIVANVDLWWTEHVAMLSEDLFVTIDAPTPLPLDLAVDLVAERFGLSAGIVEGVLAIDHVDGAPIVVPPLEPELAKRIAETVGSVDLDSGWLEFRLEELSASFDVELRLAEDALEEHGEARVAPCSLSDVSLATVLRLLAYDVRSAGVPRWKRSGDALVLHLGE